jgi:hypothetical protein
VVSEGRLDPTTGSRVRDHLATGGSALVLAQEAAAAPHYPVPAELELTSTRWGSTEFHFTTDSGALPSLPRRNLLVAEESTIQARTIVTRFDGAPFPHDPVVISYKPVPEGLAGTVVGAHRVGAGRLVLCQYRLAIAAAQGDAAARALLADLVAWTAAPRPPLQRRDHVRSDGRTVRHYTWDAAG